MKFLLWMKGLFEDKDGNPSSKRIQAFILLGVGIAIAFKTSDPIITSVIFGAALGLQGVTAFQK